MKIIHHKELRKLKINPGGKADGLLFFSENGFNVPEFFIISSDVLTHFNSKENGIEELINLWKTDFSVEKNKKWAVRSSASIEDGKIKSFAGIFSSAINCSFDEIPQAIRKVHASCNDALKSGYYTGPGFEFNIILQEMISSEFSGIGFSINPLNENDDSPLITCLPGLGIKLVSGEETALTISRENNRKIIFNDEAEKYNGIVFTDHYENISIPHEKFVENVAPFLDEIFNGLQRLQKLKSFAVDVEFTVAESKLFWLQVRPVTSRIKEEAFSVWDNSNIGDNYPGITLPLTSTFVAHSYGNVYKSMCRFLGGSKKFIRKNDHLFMNMVGNINGAMYYHVTAWQQLLCQMPFGNKSSKLITKVWGAEDAKFNKLSRRTSVIICSRLFFNLFSSFLFFRRHKRRYKEIFDEVVTNFSPKELENKSHAELITKFRSLEKKLGDSWIAPMLNGFFTMIFFNALKKIVSGSRLNQTHPNFVNDILLSTGDIVSVAIVRDLQTLQKNIAEDHRTLELFQIQEPEIIHKMLQQHYPHCMEEINRYISKYGERCDEGELKIETVNYKEDPVRFIAMLKSGVTNLVTSENTIPVFNYPSVLKKHYRFNFIKRGLLLLLAKITIMRVRDRENFRFMRTKCFHVVRTIYRYMDAELLRTGKIISAGDSLYLSYDEIMNPELAYDYSAIIQSRKSVHSYFVSIF